MLEAHSASKRRVRWIRQRLRRAEHPNLVYQGAYLLVSCDHAKNLPGIGLKREVYPCISLAS